MSNDEDGRSQIDQTLEKLKGVGGMAARSVAVPMLQGLLRDQVVNLLNQYDPDKLEEYILVDYPLVREELPQKYKNFLRNMGGRFEDEIKQFVRPQMVLHWLEHPEEWIDPEEHPQRVSDIKQCHEIIVQTPGGRQWLQKQCIEVWDIAGIL